MKHFIWRIFIYTVPFLDNLYRRKKLLDPTCPICHQGEESLEHLYLKCDWVKGVWFGSDLQFSIDQQVIEKIGSWLKDKILYFKGLSEEGDMLIMKLYLILWNIWKKRNLFVFTHQPMDPKKVNKDVNFQLHEIIDPQQLACTNPINSIQEGRERVLGWKPPPVDFMKVKVNVVFDSPSLLCHLVFIVCNHEGFFLTSGEHSCLARSVVEPKLNLLYVL